MLLSSLTVTFRPRNLFEGMPKSATDNIRFVNLLSICTNRRYSLTDFLYSTFDKFCKTFAKKELTNVCFKMQCSFAFQHITDLVLMQRFLKYFATTNMLFTFISWNFIYKRPTLEAFHSSDCVYVKDKVNYLLQKGYAKFLCKVLRINIGGGRRFNAMVFYQHTLLYSESRDGFPW